MPDNKKQMFRNFGARVFALEVFVIRCESIDVSVGLMKPIVEEGLVSKPFLVEPVGSDLMDLEWVCSDDSVHF